jgi:hypothetical protein
MTSDITPLEPPADRKKERKKKKSARPNGEQKPVGYS